MRKKKIRLLLIIAVIVCVGIAGTVFFMTRSCNPGTLDQCNNGKTIQVRVGDTLVIHSYVNDAPVYMVYASKDKVLKPVPAVDAQFDSNYNPTPYIYMFDGEEDPLFRVVSAGSVEINAQIPCGPPGAGCATILGEYHFKIIATE